MAFNFTGRWFFWAGVLRVCRDISWSLTLLGGGSSGRACWGCAEIYSMEFNFTGRWFFWGGRAEGVRRYIPWSLTLLGGGSSGAGVLRVCRDISRSLTSPGGGSFGQRAEAPSGVFKKLFLEDTCPFCGVIDSPVLDFWWHLPWFQSQGGSLTSMFCHLHTKDSSDSPLAWHLLTSWWPARWPVVHM